MTKRSLLTLSLATCLAACTPAADDDTNQGGKGGTAGGSGGSAGGSSGGSGGSGGSTAGSGGSSTAGSGGSSAGGMGGAGGSAGAPAGGAGGAMGGMGGGGGAMGGMGGGMADAGAGDMGAPNANNPAAALHDLVITVPCANQNGTGKSCSLPADVRAFDKPYMIGGTAGTTYNVKLKVCAIFEAKPYNGCTDHPESPKICINGMPGAGGFAPTYPTLAIKAGDNTYYLNKEAGYADKIFKFDYTATFEMQGGSMINILSNGGSNGGIYTAYQGPGMPTCPNVPGVEKQPYLGQFIHFQVVSAEPK